MARAFAYADGREAHPAAAPEERGIARIHMAAPPAGAGVEPPAPYVPTQVLTPQPPAPPAAAPAMAPSVMDPALHEILLEETSSHLQEIRAYLNKRNGQPAPHDLPEGVFRAIHTLSGSCEDGGGAARHPHCRAAESCHAQGIRQRPGPDERWMTVPGGLSPGHRKRRGQHQ